MVHDDIYDNGLNELAEGDLLIACSAIPDTFEEAIDTYALGEGAPLVSAPTPAVSPLTGRGVRLSVAEGTGTVSGTATAWALVDLSTDRLLVSGLLATPRAIVEDEPFTMSEFFALRIPAPV